MINKRADLDLLQKLRNSSHMVGVIVSDEHVIDLFQTRELDRLRAAIGVAFVVSRPARIHQERLARGRNQQRQLASLHVEKINLQLGGLCETAGYEQKLRQYQR